MPDHPCHFCGAAPVSGTDHYREPHAFSPIHVYNLRCPAGHDFTHQTDGG